VQPGHAAKAETNSSGAGGLYPSDACGLILSEWRCLLPLGYHLLLAQLASSPGVGMRVAARVVYFRTLSAEPLQRLSY
jgi:hypothetical protein